MLVLTRKSNQTIMIGDDIEISVLAIVGEKVRIGIRAPRDVPVFRKEVYLEIQGEGLRLSETPAALADTATALADTATSRTETATLVDTPAVDIGAEVDAALQSVADGE